MKLMVISAETSGSEKPWIHILRQYALQDSLKANAPEGLRYHCLFGDDLDNALMLFIADDASEEPLIDLIRQSLGGTADITVEPVSELTDLSEAYDVAMERLTDRKGLSPIVNATKEYIMDHYSDSTLDLTKVAGALSVHPVYLSRLMKQELGMPFAKYLSHVRIGRAVELMQNSAMKIWQVSQQVVYRDPNYFSAAFKKVLGVSPAEYRSERNV